MERWPTRSPSSLPFFLLLVFWARVTFQRERRFLAEPTKGTPSPPRRCSLLRPVLRRVISAVLSNPAAIRRIGSLARGWLYRVRRSPITDYRVPRGSVVSHPRRAGTQQFHWFRDQMRSALTPSHGSRATEAETRCPAVSRALQTIAIATITILHIGRRNDGSVSPSIARRIGFNQCPLTPLFLRYCEIHGTYFGYRVGSM